MPEEKISWEVWFKSNGHWYVFGFYDKLEDANKRYEMCLEHNFPVRLLSVTTRKAVVRFKDN